MLQDAKKNHGNTTHDIVSHPAHNGLEKHKCANAQMNGWMDDASIFCLFFFCVVITMLDVIFKKYVQLTFNAHGIEIERIGKWLQDVQVRTGWSNEALVGMVGKYKFQELSYSFSFLFFRFFIGYFIVMLMMQLSFSSNTNDWQLPSQL